VRAGGIVTSDLMVDDAIGSATDLVERANLVSWEAAFAQATEDRQWIIEGMVRHGDNVAVAGPPGSGKSLFFLDVAARLAIGDQVVGFGAQEPMNVLYLDHENNRDDITLRLQDMGLRAEQLDKLRYASFPSLDPLDTKQGGRHLYQLAHALDADVLIIDTISRFVDGDENAADTWQNVYRHAIAPLKAVGRTVIRLDHTGRDESRDARGSSAKRDDPDAVWMFKSTPADLDGKCVVTLTLRKRRGDAYVPSIEFNRKTAPLAHRVVITKPETELLDRIEKCVAALDVLDVPISAGRPSCAGALREHGYGFRNDVIAEAVRARKLRPPVPA
jgi:AAA domain